MRKLALLASLALLAGASLVGSVAFAGGDRDDGRFSARLSGYNEVPPISTTGSGSFKARLDDDVIRFRLRYSDLEGGPVGAAHIHFGQRSVNGGVVTFLCGGGSKPDACPAEGTVTGTITPDDVTSTPDATAQGIASGEFDELVRAMENHATYVNVHTQTFPSGEIRGDIRAKD
jgi:hypothetical protein